MERWNPNKIKELRKLMKLSQEGFAQALGVTRNYVYYLERGERKPSKTILLLLDCINNKAKGGKCA